MQYRTDYGPLCFSTPNETSTDPVNDIAIKVAKCTKYSGGIVYRNQNRLPGL